MIKSVASRLWVASSIIIGCLATFSPTTAQIVPDNTLPVNSIVTPGCTICTIDGGTVRGTNLFHSFSEFGVPTGGLAFFNNALQIQNILTRVTGNSVSNIDGLISANGTANLFLINPNGISFGEKATLNLGGSFIASTASSLVFADGTVFSAKPDTSTPPLLTISVPLGLQYGSNPGSIQVQGATLQVKSGKTLALVGGNVSLERGQLLAPGGRVELGGLAGESTVGLVANAPYLGLSFTIGVPRGDVSLSNGAVVDVIARGGGSIGVNAKNLTITQGSALLAGIPSDSGDVDAVAGDIEINATGASSLTDESEILNNVDQGAKGQGGDVNITTSQLRVSGGSQIGAGTFGEGDAGNLTVNASQQVEVIGTSARPSGLFTPTESGASGKAGDMIINTGTLLVRDGAQIATATRGEGNGGNLTVNASQQVQLIGTITTANGKFSSGLFASTESVASGKAGNVTINTGQLTVGDGAQIKVSNQGSGNAGNLNVFANSVLLNNQGQLIAETTSGEEGNINLQVQDWLLMRRNSLISAEASNNANGGNITIKPGFIVGIPKEDSDIVANADRGNGGKINITTQGIFGLEFRPQRTPLSDITASSNFGLSGIVQITRLGVEFSSELAKLPETLTDSSNQIVTSCQAAAEGNSFSVTGRGGLPEDPTATIRGQTLWRDFQDYSQGTGVGQVSPQNPQALIGKPSPRLVEANSWVYGPNGEVILIATAPNVTSQRTWPPAVNCGQVSQRERR